MRHTIKHYYTLSTRHSESCVAFVGTSRWLWLARWLARRSKRRFLADNGHRYVSIDFVREQHLIG